MPETDLVKAGLELVRLSQAEDEREIEEGEDEKGQHAVEE